MRLFEIVSPALTFRTEMRGHQSGQSDQTLVALRDGQYVGHIDYSVYQDEPHVQMIAVPHQERRKGIGTALVQQLQSNFPDIEINMGSLTDDGSKLLASMPQSVVPNPQYDQMSQRLEQLQAKDAAFKQKADSIYAHPSEAGRQWLHTVSDEWNAINDEIYSLEKDIRAHRPSTRTFNLTAPSV